MRWLRDIALLVLLIGLGSGVIWWQQEKREEQARLDKTTADTQRLEREVRYRAATKTGELNARGWPVTIDPVWFELDPPQNLLVTDDRPWVEVASFDEAGLMHPRIRMTVDSGTASFWYNPFQGVVRARVPVAMTDEQAVTMYNAANRVSITAIDWREVPMDIPKPNLNKESDASAQKDSETVSTTAASKSIEPERPIVIVHRSPRVSRK